MTYLTYKSYIRREFERYLRENYKGTKKYLNLILKLSEKDYRLAVISQCYFYTHKGQEAGDSFERITQEKYKSLDQLISSQNKYSIQFDTISNSNNRAKDKMISKIEKYMDEYKIKPGTLSRKANIDRSNLHKVIKNKNYSRLSTSKLTQILKYFNTIKGDKINANQAV